MKVCPDCNKEMGLGIEGRYHHFYLEWDGICTAKSAEEVIEKRLK